MQSKFLCIIGKTPDLLFVSESNLMETLPEMERQIEGYSLHLPLTMRKHRYARLILLVREGIDVKIHLNLMHEDIAAIWVSIRCGNKYKMKIGGIYREHQLMLKPKPNPSKTEAAQLARWNIFINCWKRAAKDKTCIVIGDTNLDYLTWDNPETHLAKMVDRTKLEIETIGFIQIIRGVTRSWRKQRDSLLDQCWTNRPECIISWQNEQDASSDHNIINLVVRMKEKCFSSQEIKKRHWKFFCPLIFREEIGKLDWTPLYEAEKVDLMNSIFEEKMSNVLNLLAPMKTFQLRKKFRNWIDQELKVAMLDRDLQRDIARLSDLDSDWISYRRKRNDCTKLLKSKKDEYMSNLFNSFNSKNDTKSTYRTTKNMLGWTTPGPPNCLMIEKSVNIRGGVQHNPPPPHRKYWSENQ